MDKTFVLSLQAELLYAGYDDVELKYFHENLATFNLTSKGAVRKLGIELVEPAIGSEINHVKVHEGTGDPDAKPVLIDFKTVKELATIIFDRDPGTHTLPDFKHFTGLNDES